MDMLFPTVKTGADPLLFDIRLKTTENDVILINGSIEEASSIFLSGVIVLSVKEPIQIKKIALKMNGILKVNTPMTHNPNKFLRYSKRLYQHSWDDLSIRDYLQNLYTNHTRGRGASISTKSSSNLAPLAAQHKSSASLVSLNGSTGHHTLVRGNYELPFNTILPGSIHESVEGLTNASMKYYLEAVIERRCGNDLICTKPIRVVRTLNSDALELTETVVVENVWPDKVEYCISVPSKANPVGALIPIDIVMVPLLKGLKSGPIKVTLVEIVQTCGNPGTLTKNEHVITKLKLKDPKEYLSQYVEDESYHMEDIEFQDKWEIQTAIQIPPSLAKCTQDCTIKKNIKVSHKLKFVICLINPDGHVSELRASLPVQLFISPFLTVGVNSTSQTDIIPISYSHDVETNNLVNAAIYKQDDGQIFTRSGSHLELSALENLHLAEQSVCDLMAPPNYGSHVRDKILSEPASAVDVLSNDQEPAASSNASIITDDYQESLPSMRRPRALSQVPSITIADLSITSNRRLSNTHNDNDNNSLDSRVTSNRPSIGTRNRFRSSTLLSIGSINDRGSILTNPSRESSMLNMTKLTPQKADWEMESLSKVPSYENAMHSDIIDDELPPTYPENEKSRLSSFKASIMRLKRPQIIHQKSSTSLSSIGKEGIVANESMLNDSNNVSNLSLGLPSSNSSTPYPVTSRTALSNTIGPFGMGIKSRSESIPLEDENDEETQSGMSWMKFKKSQSNNTNKDAQSKTFANNIMGLITRKEKK
ncbi:Rog3p NDAI_0H03620 [Naumovozyma dairenensis CBS 421]|uniref:Arrestin C-terminal-like domain-containing protein n=1 Tax=Naumovozyma dairenensis (strain ATCC 10597 / BCRC 20456 / CBS 421 / NBRC 0211 / NRRL Y-12639) TaxID=1071378 RepID=G0WFH4_NAUDC|nr:hypothetical protein NDAI_0H03620 [Naumovozyma dairenensis CBS 421]CCD26535.1 hypothetical protein NDAI_0H03620 [Naumovozyma dairenensis CBS 421]